MNWKKLFNQPPQEVNKLLLEEIIQGEAKYEPLFIIPHSKTEEPAWILYFNFERFGSFLYEKGVGCHNIRIIDNKHFQYSFSLERYIPFSPTKNDIVLTTTVPLKFIKDKLKYKPEEKKDN